MKRVTCALRSYFNLEVRWNCALMPSLAFLLLLTVMPTSAAWAQACTAPIEGDLGCLGTASATVENMDGNSVSGTCGGGTSLSRPDNVFTFTCSGAGTVSLAMGGMDCDMDLYVLGPGDCTATGSCEAISAEGLDGRIDLENLSVRDESLTFSCTPNETYYVVVDAWGQAGQTDCSLCMPFPSFYSCDAPECEGSYAPWTNAGKINCDDSLAEGNYTLSVVGGASLGCGEHCTDGVDNNGNGAVDCADSGCEGHGACAVVCSGCRIDGACHADGSSNVSNACEICDVSRADDAWTAAAGTITCRPSMGDCDVAEICTGTICPADTFLGPSVECRASTGSCDAAERCAGTAPACPSDGAQPDGSSCADAITCDGIEVCMSGVCGGGPPLSCEDGNECTIDTCAEPRGCRNIDIIGCCNLAADCDDGDACTVNSCTGPGGTCTNSPISGCCEDSTDCDDGVSCTADSCDLSTNSCLFEPISGCCGTDGDCDDSNVCTVDSCSVSDGLCANTPTAGCCLLDGDCADGDVCTADSCADSVCVNAGIEQCCATDEACDDGIDCTADTCNPGTNRCEFEVAGICCVVDADCADEDDCTLNTCDEFGACSVQIELSCCEADCDDRNSCTVDHCLEDRVTCTHDPIATCCTSHSQCDEGMVCAAGLCRAPVVRDSGVTLGDGGLPPTTDGGCGCRIEGSGDGRGASLSIVLLLSTLALLWRRRRAEK